MNFITLATNLQNLTLDEYLKMSKAKKSYKKNYPECASCGSTKGLEVHHILPVSKFPHLASDPNNFITLCDGLFNSNSGCHCKFGHFGNFKSKYNIHIREYAIFNRLFIEKYDPGHKFIIPTKKLIDDFFIAENISKERFLVKVNNLLANLENYLF